MSKQPPDSGLGREIPPLLDHVFIFFDQAGFEMEEARKFYDHYAATGWKGIKGRPLRNWKTKAQEWIWELKTAKPYLRFVAKFQH
jgi:hypothetical protein